jgi:DNA mismatch repair protein MutS2
MPGVVLERAARFLTREDRSFEAVVKKLHDERAALELARAAAEQREREAGIARSELEAERAALRDRERRTLSEDARALMARLRRAGEELRDARARLRAPKVEPAELKEAERALERVSREFAIGGALESLAVQEDPAQRESLHGADLRKGLRVWVQRLRAEGEVVEVLGSDQVRVAAGPLKLTVSVGELRRAKQADAPPVRPPTAAAAAPASDLVTFPTGDNTCDLRGLRVDDAVALATSFLDRALSDGKRCVFLLHGGGTGALRDALRKELARTPYVARFANAEADRGGERMTAVWLA